VRRRVARGTRISAGAAPTANAALPADAAVAATEPSEPVDATAPSAASPRENAVALGASTDARAKPGRPTKPGSRDATLEALLRVDGNAVDLDSLSRASCGLTSEPTGTMLRNASCGAIRPGSSPRLVGLANTQGSSGGPAPAPPPDGDVQIAPFTPEAGPPITGAERVIAALRTRVRACYRQGLARDPSMAGTLALDVVVAPNGDVDRTRVTRVTGIEGQTAACIASVVRRVEFDPPGGSGVTLPLNMTFVPKKK